MISLKQFFFGERCVTKVVGLFTSRFDAYHAAHDLMGDPGLAATQIKVLNPMDGEPSRDTVLDRAVKPERRGIWLTLIRAHVTIGALGLAAGTALYVAFIVMGNAAIRSMPALGFAALACFGIAFGLMVVGMLSLCPDQGRVITVVRHGLRHGRWAVVAHPLNAGQTHRAVNSLVGNSLMVVRSF